jgi:2,3-bisphosphoglycerate-dependent phosphoglycerate mutase
MSPFLHLTLLRHGRSRADDEGVCEGRYDSPLTDVGRAQVRARADGWLSAGVQFDCIIASTLQRAHETAQIVAGTLGAPLETDPDWMEFNSGPLAGLPFAVAEERYPKPAFRGPFEPFWGTGESEWELYCRAARALEKVVRRGPGYYLVVAHGGILNAALRIVVGAQPPVMKQGIWFAFSDTGYARAMYSTDQNQWVLQELYNQA